MIIRDRLSECAGVAGWQEAARLAIHDHLAEAPNGPSERRPP